MQSLLFDIFVEEPNDLEISNDLKKCSKCNEYKSKEEFRLRSDGNYRRTECKKCSAKLSKEAQELRKIHGNPLEDYICPICQKNSEEVRGLGGINTGDWVIDHNHKTNVFRGWLCHKCNRGLGAFDDDPILLERAKQYLLQSIK